MSSYPISCRNLYILSLDGTLLEEEWSLGLGPALRDLVIEISIDIGFLERSSYDVGGRFPISDLGILDSLLA